MGTLIGLTIYIVLITILVIIAHKNHYKFIYVLMFLSFAVKGTLVLINYHYGIFELARDALAYDSYAWEVASYLSGNISFPRSAFNFEYAYTVSVGIIYWIFGHHPQLPGLINALFTTLTMWNVYRLALLFFGNQRGANAAALIYALSPYIAVLSFYILRDAAINYLLSQLCFVWFSRLNENKRPVSFSIITLMIIIGLLRPENMVLLFAILWFSTIINILTESRTILWPLRIGFYISVLLVLIIVIYNYMSEYRIFHHFEDVNNLNYIAERSASVSKVKSGYLTWITFNSWYDLIIYGPLKVIYFLLSPFPWDIFKPSQYVFAADALLLLFIYICSIKGLYLIVKTKRPYAYVLLLLLIIGVFSAALVQSNAAGAQRHRTQFTFLFYAMASHKLAMLGQRRLDRGNFKFDRALSHSEGT